jgi:hypothetical protein
MRLLVDRGGSLVIYLVKILVFSWMVFGGFSFVALAEADEIIQARNCRNLKAQIGVTSLASNYSTFRFRALSPCLFDHSIQLGASLGWVGFPYEDPKEEEWSQIYGAEILFHGAVNMDFIVGSDFSTGLKADLAFGSINVRSSKYKDGVLEEKKKNLIGTSEFTLGLSSTFTSWTSMIGITSRSFSNGIHRIEGERVPRHDLGFVVAIDYMLN